MYLHIIYTCKALVKLQFFIYFVSLIIPSKTYLKHTLISTLRLIFTSQSHTILSGYNSQETLFYL